MPLLRVLAGALVSLGLSAAAIAGDCALSEPERATVATVKDGETLELTDGRLVRLIGAKAPSPPLGWRGDDPWPQVEASRGGLVALVQGAEIELQFGGERTDRYGHLLAQVFVLRETDRIWVQERLIAGGLARAYSFADNRACILALLTREAEARARRTGLWQFTAYRVHDALDLKTLSRLRFSYQLVEGTIVDVGQGRGRTYLNFDRDWRTDFTVEIEGRDRKRFVDGGMDPASLQGKTIRVRGWIDWRNGPTIQATHPEQIEILDQAETKTPQP